MFFYVLRFELKTNVHGLFYREGGYEQMFTDCFIVKEAMNKCSRIALS